MIKEQYVAPESETMVLVMESFLMESQLAPGEEVIYPDL